MKMRSEFLKLVAVAAFIFGPGQPARAVVNGGFETGDFTGWTLSGNTNFTAVAGLAAHSGNFGARFGATGSEVLPENPTFLAQTSIATVPGATYTVEFWLQNLSGVFGAQISSFTANWDGTQLLSLSNTPAFPYTAYSYSVTASAALTVLEFSFQHDPNFWHFDDVSVTAVGVPEGGATAALLGAALCLVYAVRRKLG